MDTCSLFTNAAYINNYVFSLSEWHSGVLNSLEITVRLQGIVAFSLVLVAI